MTSTSHLSRRTCIAALGLLPLTVSSVRPRPALAQLVPLDNVPARIVGAFDAMFGGPHAGQRAVHANGVLCDGVFIPAPGATSLSRAEHFAGGPVPVLVRFSSFAAVPGMPDGNSAASPRGMAVKFLLPEGESTDIVAHSYNGFPASTPEEFLAFLRAVPDPDALEQFAAGHPAARAFLADPKPAPASYGTERYFGVNAFSFTNSGGVSTLGRYRFVPLAGVSHLDAEAATASLPNFLLLELGERLRQAPVGFRLEVQLAGEGDIITDGALPWPPDRPAVELGTVELRAMTVVEDARQKALTFVPTNLVDGIGLTDDPMLLARTQAYRVSAHRRFLAQ